MGITVGITGGIGSGKSTICRIFKQIGIPVFEADLVAKQLIHSNEEIKTGLIHLFGKGIYMPENGVDRKKLASIIFNDDIALQKVNNLIHPVVRSEFQKWLKEQVSPYVVHEAAILFESGFYKMMDFTILVSAPERLRLKWISERDGISEKEIKERMAKQWPDTKKRELATLEIINDNKSLIIPQLLKIDTQLKKYGKIW